MTEIYREYRNREYKTESSKGYTFWDLYKLTKILIKCYEDFMFHSLFNVSTFDMIAHYLLVFDITLRRRKFPTDVSVLFDYIVNQYLAKLTLAL